MKRVAGALVFSLFMVFTFSLAQAAEKEKTIEITVKPGDTLWGYAKKYLNDPTLWPRIADYNPQIKDPYLLIPGQKVIIPLSEAAKKEKTIEITVKPGDTLWDYAKKYLNDPDLWPRIAEYNPQIENPHLIIPGQKVIIPLDVAREIKEKMREEVVEKTDELRYLRSRVAELETEIKELKKMQDVLEENARLKVENELAKEEIGELNKKIEDLEVEIASLKVKIKVLEEEIEGLKATIVRLEKELEEKKMAFWFLFILVGLGIMTGM